MPIGPMELAVILIVVLILFGPGKLSELGKSLGSTLREFRTSVRSDGEQKAQSVTDSTNPGVASSARNDGDKQTENTLQEEATGEGATNSAGMNNSTGKKAAAVMVVDDLVLIGLKKAATRKKKRAAKRKLFGSTRRFFR